MNLRLFFIHQADQLVILLDGFKRLDKNRLPAGTGAVYNSLHAAFLLDFHRDHKALAANRDQFVLNRSAFGKFPEISAQRFLNLPLLLLDLAANAAELWRSAIIQRSIRKYL